MDLIEKYNMVDEAYNQIIRMIMDENLKEGSKLPSESQLCQQMGVSRNTIRAAMSKLNALGIVETRQGYGYSIRNLNTGIYINTLLPEMLLRSRDLESIVEFRIGVESETAAVAAERATVQEKEKMRIACEKAGEVIGDPDLFAKYDMEFHRAVAEGSHNPLFIKTAEMLENMHTTWLQGLLRTHGMDRSYGFHNSIYEAIRDQSPDKARAFMMEHLQDVLTKVKMDNRRKAMEEQS